MKPLALMERAISNSSQAGEKILDLFLGSGSTLIACERTGRICYGMEIEPLYVDIARMRWEAFTGEKARLCEEEERVMEQTLLPGRVTTLASISRGYQC